ncbi:MAG: hypothetical protein KAI53_00935 [Candidatus Aenigmarchaeota archaeon]|nr:hypothetical protein [Candidatus Aenigmarchaeota archaeon]
MTDKKTILEELFLHDKPVKILVALKEGGDKAYASTLAKVADCTYSHTVKILDLFEKINLVSFEKKGRVKYIKLTETGDDIAFNLENLVRKMNKIPKKKGK